MKFEKFHQKTDILFVNCFINPCHPEVFSVTRPPKGGLLQPPQDFFYNNVLYPCLLPMYSYESPISIETKIRTIRLRMLWRHNVSASSKF